MEDGARVTLNDVQVDGADVLGQVGEGFAILEKMLDAGRACLAAEAFEGVCTDLPPPRNYRFSMVFQSAALFNSLTVGENVGLWLREKRVCPERQIRRIILEKLALVGLEGKEGMLTSELSGGTSVSCTSTSTRCVFIVRSSPGLSAACPA